MANRPKTVGLLDHMGGGNLGDDTTQTAVIDGIRRRWPDAAIVGFSMNPPDTQARHAIPAYPIRRKTWDNPDHPPAVGNGSGTTDRPHPLARLLQTAAAVPTKLSTIFSELCFLFRSFWIIRTIDIFVISGGGQLLDSWGGTWDYPYTIFKWVLLARLSGAKCYFVNVGAGPLRRPLSRFFIRHALRLADYVSFRDADSQALARRIGFSGKSQVCPDCVYALQVPLTRAGAQPNEQTVGLSPMAYCDPRRYWIKDQHAYESFVRKLVDFASSIGEHYRLALFSTDIWFDAQTLEKVDTALRDSTHVDRTGLPVRRPIDSIDSLLAQMGTMDFIVTCRFHGVVFAHLMNIPVIALSHHPKVTTLMTDLGLAEYCLDIDAFDSGQLLATFNRMAADKERVKARLAEKATLYRDELNRQFDQLFPAEPMQ
jgi:polysaccharide pyruvyl transferase WcaK-like protein